MGVVSVLSISTVTPASPTLPKNKIHKLSNLDLHVSFDYYTKQVYYFPSPIELDHNNLLSFEEVASGLRASLSKALVFFNVLAGRVRETKDGKRLEIECNDCGVPFIVAETEARFSDWDDISHCSIEQDLNPAETYITNSVDSPLLKFQLTRFKCGGIGLGIVVAELILDGSSYFEFMRSWSEINKGSATLSSLPVFDSTIFQARNPPQINIPVRDCTSSPRSIDNVGKAKEDHQQKLGPASVVKLFEMNPNQVDALIREVQAGPFGFDTPTSFEATSAMIWKAITDARDLDDSTLTTYFYSISLKAKNRWNPPVPRSYVGNSVHSPCLTSAAGEIKSKHISYVARLFRQDIRSITVEHIQSTIDWMELELDRGRKINFNCDFVSGTGVYSTSLHTFPVYEVDIGMGKPVHYSLVLQPWYGNGVVIVLPTPKGGRNRQLLVSLPKEKMVKLCHHDLMQRFTTAI